MSVTLPQLWLPILLSGVLAWLASSLVHILLKFHNRDYQMLANEDAVAAAIRAGKPDKGIHALPYCTDMKQMGDPDMQRRFAEGPVAFVTIFDDGLPAMGKLMVQQFAYFVIGALLIGYCATLALPAGAPYLAVLQFVSATGFLAYGWATIPYSIWYGHPWPVTLRFLLDALIYGFVTAGTFGWLWPAATAG